jgi:hypothetical protein
MATVVIATGAAGLAIADHPPPHHPVNPVSDRLDGFVAGLKAGWQGACGCPLDVQIKDGFTTHDAREKASGTVQELLVNAQNDCATGDEAKHNYCAVKTLVIAAGASGAESAPKLAGSTLTATENVDAGNAGYVGSVALTLAIDSFHWQRAYVHDSVQPELDKAQQAIQASCGCAVAASLDLASFRHPADVQQFGELEKARDSAVTLGLVGSYCAGGEKLGARTPAEIKRGVCTLKAASITQGKKDGGAHATASAGKLVIATDVDANAVGIDDVFAALGLRR